MVIINQPTAVLCPKCGQTLRRMTNMSYPESDQLYCKHCSYEQQLRIEITTNTELNRAETIIQETIDQLETMVTNLAHRTLEV